MLKNYYKENYLEVGVDEVGRGCLAGPVVAGAVIWDPKIVQEPGFIIRDSKKISERKRYIIKDFIKENAIDSCVVSIDNKRIDSINILKASHEAMHKAIRGLRVEPELILVDGNRFPHYMDNNDNYIEHECIPGGDDIYCSIAASSILAKCERDTWINNLCDKYPELDEKYNWKKNKGYGTSAHMDGIKKYGLTEWHRKSFGPCKIKVI